MSFNNFLILITVIAGWIIGASYFLYVSFRNIYTQQLLYLNEKFSKMDSEEISKHKISDLRKFRFTMEGEERYPPLVNNDYLKNTEYRELVNGLNNRRIRLDRIIKKTIFGYLGLLLLLVLSYWLF
ncbi:MAG: hypothetical protein AAFX57_13230 [Bacteroidota bacterium]